MMKNWSPRARAAAAVAALCVVCAAPALAEDKKLGWSDVAEFSLVWTDGNSESQSLGFKNTLTRTWENALFELRAGGIRVESTSIAREAFGTRNVFIVEETKTTEVTAENYYLNGRYNRNVTDRFFWYGGLGWDRNRFAGIENRWIAEAGVGNIWRDEERVKFRTLYAATFTDQEDVFPVEGADDSFLGARFSWDYLHKFGANTTYTNTLVLDANLDETSDWRGDMINALAVSMNSRMALKVSLQWLYDNQPSFAAVDLVGTNFTVPVELDELDSILTVSLVVNF